ncbi:hypothetical protein [Romboutsia lituseburensis]|uniref:O-antigen ligase like membrane protein n=1 Tax=Romboutsia lituseburensis DSM 797 TaxID=1121325 RepID=A0A1G9PJL6_9FIRM|nr:hypothetical protein [Romboutsia lituseburensis]CEH33397.1 Hypothetical protein RLITU_0795 [Romboutsia lituseburensis]SDL98407.1 hypothetical protein SAMN04515677_104373 [Romboutsia lituseburensis DSM 797]
MTNKKLNIDIKNIFIFFIITLFIFPQEIRSGILGGKFGTVNFIAVITIGILFLKYIKNINKIYFAFWYITILIYLFTASLYEVDLGRIIKCILIYFMPLLIIGFELEKKDTIKILKFWLNTINCIIIVITVIGIIEKFLGINIMIELSKFMTPRIRDLVMMQQSEKIYRLYSFMGHPLFNTQMYLIFFVINNIYSYYILNNRCKLWVAIFSIVGISLTASKTGIVMISLAIVLLFKVDSKVSKIIIIALIIILGNEFNLFDNVITRFMGDSLTTGRSEKWEFIKSMNQYPMKFFTGYGNGFVFELNNYINWASAAFEYPIRMFAFEFGILTMVLIYIPIMIIPTFLLIKRRQVYLLISYYIVFIQVNTYNGLALHGDYMLIFCFFVFMIINISKMLKGDVKKYENSFFMP